MEKQIPNTPHHDSTAQYYEILHLHALAKIRYLHLSPPFCHSILTLNPDVE
jgi:hypothetical protein